ncbi:MAG: class I SAM-dependent methyltransferase [Flavobacteriales bacterium]|nr:class I SAM-dependent methyltransferase [Flavobacteriales bacterium]
MKAPVNTAFSGSIPRQYDAHLGPMFFEPFAELLAGRIATLAPDRVLELAAGTGRLTRHLVDRLADHARIVATDVNPAMLEFAQKTITAPRVEWNVVDAVDLPYADASFDLVVAQFGVMFYSDRVKAYREALRVLKPGGRMILTAWNALQENPAARYANEVAHDFFPVDTPNFYTVPFAYHDRELIREELLTGGFARVKLELATPTGQAASAQDAATGLLEGSPIHTAIMERDAKALPAMKELLAALLTAEFGTGALQVPLSAWVVEAVKD